MKNRHFLGKIAREHHIPKQTKRKKVSAAGLAILVAPFIFAAGFFSISSNIQPGTSATEQATLTRQASTSIRFAAQPVQTESTTVLASGETDTESTDGFTLNCSTSSITEGDLFPLIPKQFTKDGPDSGKCPPSYWDRGVIGAMIFKLLGIANYVAAAAAVIVTIYGGILYLTGFASEENAKRAKTIIIGTYIGLFIVLGARLIVQGSFYLFGNPGDSGGSELNLFIEK